MDRNPYAPPTAAAGAIDTAHSGSVRVGRTRSPGEYVLLASLAGTWMFWAYHLTFGAITIRGSNSVAIALLLGMLVVAAISFWLIFQQRLIGALLCALFYGAQLVSFTLSSGVVVGMNSLPTINIRIGGDQASPVSLNLVALVLFVFSLALCAAYYQRRTDAD